MNATAFFPHPLFVYPSRRCNLTCSYCFTSSDLSWQSETFLTHNWPRLIQEAHEIGIPEIRISGGEPLLLPNIKELCTRIVVAGLRYTLTTNGVLLARHLSWLHETPPATFWISLHVESTSSQQFIRCVERAAAFLPEVGVNLFARDILRDSSLPGKVVKAGAVRMKFLRLTPVGRFAGDIPEDQQAVVELVQRVAAAELGAQVELRFEGLGPQGVAHAGTSTCVLNRRPLLSIDHDGRCYPCCVTLGAGGSCFGDLRVESLYMVAQRALAGGGDLPCRSLLPGVAAGRESCPLHLTLIGK